MGKFQGWHWMWVCYWKPKALQLSFLYINTDFAEDECFRSVRLKYVWKCMVAIPVRESTILCEVLEICIVDPSLICSPRYTAETHFRQPLWNTKPLSWTDCKLPSVTITFHNDRGSRALLIFLFMHFSALPSIH